MLLIEPKQTVFLTECFATAVENMAFDAQIAERCQQDQNRYFRLYLWQTPGITYAAQHGLPSEAQHWDHAARLTGGGIVFHQPGDVLLTCVTNLDDPLFAGKFKDKLFFFPQLIHAVFQDLGIMLDPVKQCKTTMHKYCAQYDSPYELTYQGKKILGVSVRKWKTVWMVQVIITLSTTIREQVEGREVLNRLRSALETVAKTSQTS